MTCCIALAMAIGIVRTAWRWLLGRGEETTKFAPVARRPAPESIGFESEVVSREPSIGRGRARLAAFLRAATLAVGVYAFAVFVLIDREIAIATSARGDFVARTLVYAAIAAIAAVAAYRLDRGDTEGSPRDHLALGSFAMGALWFELGVLDTEVFRLFQIGSCTCCGWKTPLFLAAGPLVALVAAILVARRAAPIVPSPEIPR